MKILRYLSALIFLLPIIPSLAQVTVNADRLEESILKLATFGMKENGETNRVAFSDADLGGRDYVMKMMQEAGLEVSIDFAGNIIGMRKGAETNLKPIAFGSHIDMVPDGGNYDGCLGSLAAIEVIRTFNENDIQTRHPLEVIIFSNEEGGVMGSRALAGQLGPAALDIPNSTGYTMGEGISRLGGDPDRLQEVVREKGSLAAFLELHIEQGAYLEEQNIDIGVVEGIVGLQWWDVEIEGFANHAGTTPMDKRQDALLAAALFVQAVSDSAKEMEGRQVATVGRIKAEPGAPNVIPGKVVLSLEIRDLSTATIDELYNALVERSQGIAEKTGTTFTFKLLDTTGKPAMMDSGIQQAITSAAKKLNLSTMRMPSGAGHDAQDMAVLAPTGMIFVPSVGGISHSPKEYTSPEDMANGANVLLYSILSIDKDLD